jgi:hypothetical protein
MQNKNNASGDSVPYLLTNEFKISNLIIIQPSTEQKEYEPGQNILIVGDATKENGQNVNGFIEMEILAGNSTTGSIIQAGTINNGMYSINITLLTDMRAGNYLLKLNAYEMSPEGTKTNKGFINYNIAIKQIPTYLELMFETINVEPGTNVKVKAILHDQTGDKINSNAIITIKKGTTDIQIQSDKITDEFLEFPIAYNEPPSNWTVFAMSNQLVAESYFFVIENKRINAEIENETIIFKNVGNVPYNDTVLIKIGNESIDVLIFLDIDGIQKYELKAPNGEYQIEVLDEKGESKISQMALLTGRAIDVRNLSESSMKVLLEKPLALIFIALVVLTGVFILVRKIRKRGLYETGQERGLGLFKKKVKQPKINTAWENRAMPLSKNSKLETKNKANLSISIKGNKQDVSIVNLNIKNNKESKGNTEEPLQKIINLAENKKAFVYENQDNIFFILTPSKTRTLQNEKIALEIAQEAKEIISSYNKTAKYKINFGISLEYGSIVEKIENGILDFMSLGTLMTNAKRISSVSQEEVLLGEKIKDKLTSVRTEKQDNGKVVSYKIKEIKYHDEEHSRFIKNFLKKAEERKEDFKVI